MNLLRVRLLAIAMMLTTSVSSLGFQQRSNAQPAGGGTATVSGIVVSADIAAQPLRRAIVTIRSNQALPNRSAITDDDGRFVIRQVPVGRVMITAAKPGYVAAAYGAMRPARPGTPVALAAGQTFDARILMSRAAVMTGIVRDEEGRPLPDVRVFAIDARQPAAPSPARSLSGTSVSTDDRGVFRLFDLVPGEYVIAAVPTTSLNGEIARRSDAATEALLAKLQNRSTSAARTPSSAPAAAEKTAPATLAPIYFPSTPALSSAGRIQVSSGEVREGLDFTLMSVPVTTIEGAVVSDAGPLPPSVRLLISADSSLEFPGLNYVTARLDQRLEDGRFKYSMITPGHYVISARADKTDVISGGRGGRGGGAIPPPPPPPPIPGADGPATSSDTLYGVEEIDVTGAPVSGVTVRLQRGSTVTGRLRFDAASLVAPADLTTLRVGLQVPQTPGFNPVRFATNQSVALGADGTFKFVGIAPGRYNMQVTMPTTAGSGWWLRSALVGDRDMLDSGLDVTLGTDVSDAVLTMTDRHTELSGTLQTAAGLPATEYFVIVMPADPALRMKGSRRVKTTRPASDGRFSITDLPAGDYLLVALTDVEPNEWQLPEFLASIANAGVRISLAEGEKKTQNLRIEK